MQPFWTYLLTQGFGATEEPLDSGAWYQGVWYPHFNKGYDFGVPVGTPIHSTIAGTVIAVGDTGDGWGTKVWIKDANGNIHNFGHLSAAQVQVGQQVNAGDLIAASGNTGASTGPHLSYDVWDSAMNYLDPGQFINAVSETPVSASPPPPAPGAPGGSNMNRDQLAQQLYGKPYSELTIREQIAVDDAFAAQAPPSGTPSAGLTTTVVGPDGQLHRYQYNQATGRYDIDLGLASEANAGARPQGAVTTSQLQQSGAIQTRPGEMQLEDGSVYRQNGDGTWTLDSSAKPQNQTIVSGAGVARLFPQKSASTTQNTLTSPPTSTTATGPAGGTQVRRGNPASANPLNRTFTFGDIQRAGSQEGIQPGDILGAAEDTFTGLGGPLPITAEGIYEGGGLTPIKGTMNTPSPQFGGRVPGSAGNPDMGVGIGFSPDMILRGSGLGSLASKPNATDIAFNLMTKRQQAADLGLDFPDLESIKGLESQGRLPKGTYKEKLAQVSASLGEPLSELDLLMLELQDLQQPTYLQAEGGTNFAGFSNKPIPGGVPDFRERVWKPASRGGGFSLQGMFDDLSAVPQFWEPPGQGNNAYRRLEDPDKDRDMSGVNWGSGLNFGRRDDDGYGSLRWGTPEPDGGSPQKRGSIMGSKTGRTASKRMGRLRAGPMMFNKGGGFTTGEEIAMVGMDSGKVYAVAGEGPDGIGGKAAPERIDVTPMNKLGRRGNPKAQLGALAMLQHGQKPLRMRAPFMAA